jgi:hypothetical protein
MWVAGCGDVGGYMTMRLCGRLGLFGGGGGPPRLVAGSVQDQVMVQHHSQLPGMHLPSSFELHPHYKQGGGLEVRMLLWGCVWCDAALQLLAGLMEAVGRRGRAGSLGVVGVFGRMHRQPQLPGGACPTYSPSQAALGGGTHSLFPGPFAMRSW